MEVYIPALEKSWHRQLSKGTQSLQGLDVQKSNPLTGSMRKRNYIIEQIRVIWINYIDKHK